MISTSEIRVSCIIEEKYGELAVRVLHKVFNMNEAKKNSALKGNERIHLITSILVL